MYLIYNTWSVLVILSLSLSLSLSLQLTQAMLLKTPYFMVLFDLQLMI